MSDEDWWSRFYKKRRWPFFRGFFTGDIDKIFQELEEMMEREYKTLSEKAPRELIRERTLPDGRKVKQWGPFVYGYSVTLGPDGKPQIKEFGNVKPGTQRGCPKIEIKEHREPLVDVFETEHEVKVVAELPGVEKKDIKLHGMEDSITISVDTPDRKYYKKVELPTKIESKQAKSTYKHGVLEITLPKKKKTEPKGEPINIE